MLKRKLITLALATVLSLSTGLIGCGYNNITNDGNMGKRAATSTKMSNKHLWNNVKDTSMKYSASNFLADLKAKGYELIDTTEKTSNFSVASKTYTLNGQKISVYEYGKTQHKKIKSDINSITNNGTKIKGKNVDWNVTPHIYKKGRVVVVYDGDDTGVKTALKDILGNPVLG